MKSIMICLVLVSLLFLSGCGFYMAPVMPPQGLLFTSTSAPLDTNVERTEIGDKTGESTAISILTLFAFGDCSVESAARNGNIDTVTYADYSYINVLGIYQGFTTIVYGN